MKQKEALPQNNFGITSPIPQNLSIGNQQYFQIISMNNRNENPMITKKQARDIAIQYLQERKRDYINIASEEEISIYKQKKILYGEKARETLDVYIVYYTEKWSEATNSFFIYIEANTGSPLYTISGTSWMEEWEDMLQEEEEELKLEEIKAIGYQILKDLSITNYHEDAEPFIRKNSINIKTKDGVSEIIEGWNFFVDAPHCTFGEYRGVYAISLYQDGKPYSISDITCGRGMILFLYLDTDGKYKAVARIEDLPE